MKELSVETRMGRAMRDARRMLDLSQDEFADLIDMHRAYYGAIERGEKNITLRTMLRVAKGLGTTMSRLLEGIE